MNRFMVKSRIILVFVLVMICQIIAAQKDTYNLDQVIKIAQSNSPDAQVAKYELIASYWTYRTFKRALLPQFSLTGELPSINRAFTKYTNADGTESYIGQQYISYSGNLSVQKTLGFTGGNVFLSTGLQRIDNFYDSTTVKSFLSTPVSIGFSQPLFDYNPYKWTKQIEPLKYDLAQQRYLEAVENVAITAVNNYFNLLQAQLDVQINQINVHNYDTLFKIAKGRYSLGKIEENDLLQLELNLLQSKAALENSVLSYENALFKFKSFLRLPPETLLELSVPKPGDFMVVDKEKALEQATRNSSTILNFEKQLLQANSSLDMAKKQNGLNANLYAVFGLSQNAADFANVYRDPRDQQNVNVGIQIPIYDWGMKKGQVIVAKNDLEIVKSNVEQQKIDFRQEIYIQVADFNMQQNQLNIAAKSDTVAAKSFDISKNRYYMGKITVTDLNIAQKANDQARLSYLAALKNYWEAYYRMRKSTLYDFKANAPISVDYNELVK